MSIEQAYKETLDEIEKMYENAGIKPKYIDACTVGDKYWQDEELANEYGTFDMYMNAKCGQQEDCTTLCSCAYTKAEYPLFTAEKQIVILQFCLKWGQVHILKGIDDEYRIENSCYRQGYQPTLADAIANYINEKWEKLTPEEKQQVKGILE